MTFILTQSFGTFLTPSGIFNYTEKTEKAHVHWAKDLLIEVSNAKTAEKFLKDKICILNYICLLKT